ncbi:Predicted DNA-binding protein with PD1-like DNA-binding motif [Pseudomonas asturiensis]|uniref:Predicted DNA-binding protein with PD1-like DNA-binding motif n=1 Tax=Pseudomonas asturiensis TaxID=1190415 RepID=A0A1M7PUJ3_9PSED|nr:PPC domain-containing DNA-binding protein [Pseudomonas asturiensis]SHN21082.1 Predicted DNA-binding protein with PD1-like DNA-binding motif [Pseudomonas asturiensis]
MSNALTLDANSESTTVQKGSLGRLIIARLKPNEDIIESAEALCSQHGVKFAVVRSGLGSLIDAELNYLGRQGMKKIDVPGPGVEILSLSGEVVSGQSRLQAVVADTEGKIYAGRLERGRNLSFITIEMTLQEWLPE